MLDLLFSRYPDSPLNGLFQKRRKDSDEAMHAFYKYFLPAMCEELLVELRSQKIQERPHVSL